MLFATPSTIIDIVASVLGLKRCTIGSVASWSTPWRSRNFARATSGMRATVSVGTTMLRSGSTSRDVLVMNAACHSDISASPGGCSRTGMPASYRLAVRPNSITALSRLLYLPPGRHQARQPAPCHAARRPQRSPLPHPANTCVGNVPTKAHPTAHERTWSAKKLVWVPSTTLPSLSIMRTSSTSPWMWASSFRLCLMVWQHQTPHNTRHAGSHQDVLDPCGVLDSCVLARFTKHKCC